MPEAQKKGWQIPQGDLHLYSTTLALFFLSLLCFGGISIYKTFVLSKELTGLEKQNNDLTQMISGSFDSNTILAAKKSKSASGLLKDHLYWSKYFEILESFTLKNIHYDQFAVKQDPAKTSSIKAEVSGHTENFAALSKQVAILIKSKEFANIKFDGGEMDKDGVVNFKLSLEISDNLIKENNK